MKKILVSFIVALSLIGNAQATALSVPYAAQKASKSRLIGTKTLVGGAVLLGGASVALQYVNNQNYHSRLPQLNRADFEKIYANPASVVPYLKKNPSQEHAIMQQVVANLNRPVNQEQYKTYGDIAGYLGIPGFSPPEPIDNKPPVLINEIEKIKIPNNTENPISDLYKDKNQNIIPNNRADPLPQASDTPPLETQNYKDYILQRNKSEAKELEKNMKNAGLGTKPKDKAAHHMVPWNHPKAEVPRKILKDAGIDISSADNGVYLANTRELANKTGEAYHREIHTDRYFQNINNRLLKHKGNREEITKELQKIRKELQNNTFPY